MRFVSQFLEGAFAGPPMLGTKATINSFDPEGPAGLVTVEVYVTRETSL